MSSSGSEVAVCVPTLGRPESVQRLLESLQRQTRKPAAILIVDASEDEATQRVCDRMADAFDPGVVRYVSSRRGLTYQRRVGIDLLSNEGRFDYLCMVDDDVVLDPDVLMLTTSFLGSAEGRSYGGVSGYDYFDWKGSFGRLERFYARVGLFDGELRPGRWLRCGRFLQLTKLKRPDGVFPTDFLPGAQAVWRMEVFKQFLPPRAMDGYALGEDKHFSLRVATRYRLGILGPAGVRHERAEGQRMTTFRMGVALVRREALMLRDCDPHPSVFRYLRFLGFSLLDLCLRMAWALLSGRWRVAQLLVGSAAGWLTCVFWPPRRTQDALTRPWGARGPGRGSAVD